MAERHEGKTESKKRAADKKAPPVAQEDKIIDQYKAGRAKGVPAETVEYIGEHTVVSGDTMSHIALKFYGSAVRDKWMQIYEANKETIGENPAFIKPGQVLKIPKLTD